MVEWKSCNRELGGGGVKGLSKKLSDHCYNGNFSGDLLPCALFVTLEVSLDCLVLGIVHKSCCSRPFGGQGPHILAKVVLLGP